MAFGALLLAGPIATFDQGIWGPHAPYLHRDFLGAVWLFWAEGAGGSEFWLSQQSWPQGGLPLVFHIPNPWDGWLLHDLTLPEGWNRMQLGHHLANLGAAALFVRSTGAGPRGTLGAMALLAASPLMLHEIAGGRTLSGVAWPGLLALALLPVEGAAAGIGAGLLLGLQGLCYLYTGLLFGLAALLLRPRAGLLAAGGVVVAGGAGGRARAPAAPAQAFSGPRPRLLLPQRADALRRVGIDIGAGQHRIERVQAA